MTISSTANRNEYVGNDTTPTYNYTYKIFQESELLVIVRDTTLETEVTLVLTTDYSVASVGDSGGGTISLTDIGQAWISGTSNLNTGFELIVRRVVALTQLTDIRNQGAFYPEVHEDTFDKFTMIEQQQQDEIDRSVKLPDSSTPVDLDPTLPVDLAGTPSVCIVTDPTGTSLIVGPTTDEISNAQAYAIAAQAAQAAAEAAEYAITPLVGGAQSIASGAQIALTLLKRNEFVRVVGDAGAQTASVTPFNADPVEDSLVTIIGTDNTNTVEISSNDAPGGCLLNGPSAILALNDILSLIYDVTQDRYIEISRNF